MKYSLFLLLAGLSLISCETVTKKYGAQGLMVTGKTGEILVVCDKSLWDSEIHELLDSNLTQFIMPYYPDVATFELIHRTPAKFTDAIKRYRNTLILSIDSKYKGKQVSVEKKYHTWAHDQLLIEITAKDYNQLVDFCKNGMPGVHAAYDYYDWKRILNQFKPNNNGVITTPIEKNFGISLKLPEGTKNVWKRDNFYRLEFPSGSKPIEFSGTGTQDPGTIFSGLLIYQYDFKDSSQFSLNQLLKDRDTMLKYNVPHQVEDMYMGTQYQKEIFPILERTKNESGKISGYDMRGMFLFQHRTLKGTGGAFWAFHFIHPKRKKIICISGYVDAPSTTSWTHSLREVQAVIRSVELID